MADFETVIELPADITTEFVMPEQIVTTLEAPGAPMETVIAQPPELVTELAQPPAIETTLEVGQGPAGAPGNGSATSPATATDYTDPRYWFLGYAGNLIKRLDNAVAPPLVQQATGAWADRHALTYT